MGHTEPSWGSITDWQEANRSLDYLIRLHRHKLSRAVRLAGEVQVQLESIFPLLDDLCAVTCPWCPDPCCLLARAWIDFKDLLFLHLVSRQIPPSQLLTDLNSACRYIGPRGCLLPRVARPWTCTWYLCPTQMTRLRQKSIPVQDKFSQAVQDIKTGRKEMETEFIRMVNGAIPARLA